MVIELGQDEVLALRELLNERLDELAEEIHHTDDAEFRQRLKDRKALLTRLVGKLAV